MYISRCRGVRGIVIINSVFGGMSSLMASIPARLILTEISFFKTLSIFKLNRRSSCVLSAHNPSDIGVTYFSLNSLLGPRKPGSIHSIILQYSSRLLDNGDPVIAMRLVDLNSLVSWVICAALALRWWASSATMMLGPTHTTLSVFDRFGTASRTQTFQQYLLDRKLIVCSQQRSLALLASELSEHGISHNQHATICIPLFELLQPLGHGLLARDAKDFADEPVA